MNANTNSNVIVVTGSNGFVGNELIQRLMAHGSKVIGLDRRQNSKMQFDLPNLELIDLDLESEKSIHEAFDEIRSRYGSSIASVIHLAAYRETLFEESLEGSKYQEMNVLGTERLLAALRNFEVGQLILTSTMFVHRSCELGEQIDEDWLLEPKWADPKSKLMCEELVRKQKDLMPVVILRLAEIYDDSCRSVLLAHQIQGIYEQQLNSVIYPGDISKGKTFLHLEDLVEAILSATCRRSELPRELTVLLGEPHTLSYDYLQRSLGRLIHNQEWQTYPIPMELAQSALWLKDKLPYLNESLLQSWMINLANDHFALDATRAKLFLHWQPERSLDRTLAKMIFRFKSDPLSWYQNNGLTAPFWLEREHYYVSPVELAGVRFSPTEL